MKPYCLGLLRHRFPHIALLALVLIGVILAALVVAPGELSGAMTFLEGQGASRPDCVRDVNANGIGDVVDIQSTATELGWRVYLPLVVANWRRPWPTPTPSADVSFRIGDPLPDMPIHPLLGYYRGNDYGASSPGDGSGGPGLFYGDAAGTYKPSAHAFRLWSQIYGDYPHLLQVTLPSTDPEVPLWVLAAQDDRGTIALLVSNPSADTVTWSPRFADGTTLQDYGRVEIYQVDRTHDGRTSTPLTGASVTTPAHTVQLLVLHPDNATSR